METLIIQVDCRPFMRKGGEPPQLGITVEAPYSEQRKQLQVAKDFRNHDYHNLDDIQINTHDKHMQRGLNGNLRTNKNRYSTQLAATLAKSHSNNHSAHHHFNDRSIQSGLQITQIQKGSVSDRIGQFKVGDIIVEVNGVNLERPFAEAQKTLKQFVIEHTSHGPLILKVLRKPESSSSSIPSTTGSQMTVIEQNGSGYNSQRQQTQEIDESNIHQQFKTVLQVTQATPIKPTSPRTPKTPSTSSKTSRHLVGALNTRRIGTKYKIKLRKGSGGFGIKIAERDNMHNTKNRPIYITAITTTGSAYQDGQLKEGDMLLEVNGVDLQGKSQPDVTKMLKSVKINEEVEIVVSRQEIVPDEIQVSNGDISDLDPTKQAANDNDDSLIDLNVPEHDDSVFMDNSNQQFERKIDSILNDNLKDGPGNYVYDIPLNDTKSAGLGLYLKYPRRSSDHKDLGIWIEKVITGGAAWKDGRLQPDDQILAINGISLIGLSNAEASETLTAAVCRGIGPEATANTIKLNIQRRDPAVAAKILLGTNNSIEHSDMITKSHEKLFDNGERNESSRENTQSAFDTTMHNRSTQSNLFNNSSSSSNQNSQNDSAMSPQTQASSSLKTSSFNDKQNSSDKTNETTSSAISQITDFTSVPISDQTRLEIVEQHQNITCTDTLPKLLHAEAQSGPKSATEDNASSSQSWDDESLDANITGEEAFQRDGFGRQSISEKRHAQLNAKNTDTYKRNQKLREERERQRKLEDQMARQRLDDADNRRRSYYLPANNNPKIPSSYTTSEFKSIYGLQTGSETHMANDLMIETYNREVPVDVHMPTMNKNFIDVENPRDLNQMRYDNQVPYDYSEERVRMINQKSVSAGVGQYQSQPVMNNQNMLQTNRCLKCGAYEPSCLCESLSQQQHVAAMRSAYQIYGGISNPGFDHSVLKRSNSLESVQQHQARENLVVPRAGTVRVARNRKVNESFRAAVDRSYEGSTIESCGRHNHSELSVDHRASNIGPTRLTSSIANSTASTSNEEKYLISKQTSNGNGNVQTHKKSSLLTKLIKLGSMKKKKKKNRDEQSVETKDMDRKMVKNANNSQLIRDSEPARSHSSKGSHARTHSSQSHPNHGVHSHNRQSSQMSKQAEVTMNGQVVTNNLKHQPVLLANNLPNGFNLHQPHRMSIPMCQYQQPLIHNNINTQYHPNQAQPPITTQTKSQYQYDSLTLGRPTGSHQMNSNQNHIHHNHQQYSHPPVHQQGTAMIPSPTTGQHLSLGINQPALNNIQHISPVEMHSHPMHYQTLSTRDGRHLNTSFQNNCRLNSNIPPGSHWQSQQHQQASNGLWVTNSPTSENNLQPPVQVYGALPQQQQPLTRFPHVTMENTYTISHNPQPPISNMMPPFVPQIAGPAPPLAQPAAHLMHNHPQYTNGAGGHTHHNMQPQHIYYYDF